MKEFLHLSQEDLSDIGFYNENTVKKAFNLKT